MGIPRRGEREEKLLVDVTRFRVQTAKSFHSSITGTRINLSYLSARIARVSLEIVQ